MHSRLEEGGWTHRAPVGYLNTRDPYNPKRGVLVPDPERFQLLQRGWEMLLRDCYTVAQVLDKLNNEWNFRTRPTRKRGGVPLTISHGYKLFSNIFYAGYILHEGRLRQGSHPPMVTVGEFNRVQTILRQRRKPRTRPQFLFKGLLHCGYCGQMVTAEQHWKSGRRLVYYRCSDSFKRCTKQGIREERLEEQILRLLEGITLEPELCRIALESIMAWQESCSQSAQGTYAELHRSIESVESQLNNLLNLRLREVISDDALYRAKESELLDQRNHLHLALAEAEEELARIRDTAHNGYAFAAFARDTFLSGDMEGRRELASALGFSYLLYGHEVAIEVDPLLKEMVQFAQSISLMFEPQPGASRSRYRASFSSCKDFGRAKDHRFKPGASLQALLKTRAFPLFT